MGHPGSTAYGSMHHPGIRLFLAPDVQMLVQQHRVQPIIAILPRCGILVQGQALYTGQQFLVQPADMPVMCDVLINHRHLPTSDARTDIADKSTHRLPMW